MWYQNHLELDVEPPWFNSWPLFKKEIQANFGEVDAEATSERKLRALTMRDGTQAIDYITKFHTYANNLYWNDKALISEFRRGLPARLKDELAKLDLEDYDLAKYESTVTRIDMRYWERQEERKSETSTSSSSSSRPGSSLPSRNSSSHNRFNSPSLPYPRRPMPTTSFNNRPVLSTPPFSQAQNKPLPLNKEGHVLEAEKQRRLEKGLCGYCGGNHKIETCPKKPKTLFRSSLANFSISEN